MSQQKVCTPLWREKGRHISAMQCAAAAHGYLFPGNTPLKKTRVRKGRWTHISGKMTIY